MKINRELILASKLRSGTVAVPEWGIDALPIRELKAFESAQVNEVYRESGAIASMGKALELAVMDETGQPVFESGDSDALVQQSQAVVQRIYTEIMRLGGLDVTNTDESEKKD
ncbi:hypothetical protein [Oceanobacter sp. 3_MG-2023]|uniref:hypothetical protein n=1 Tax=Oceanobacter sp. 3_MG-2023 TaxID=3062622 RepID=UPI002735D6FD|nr:hypothetical protein [Oceanobacter sp. 3_MG-2023]MDP2505383.1 hypothetical protein [Oceanobacter sp. 3_MG-2023]